MRRDAILMTPATIVFLLIGVGCCLGAQSGGYYGKELGPLSELQHGVRGRVYAVDSRTLFLKDFHYDGAGPAAYFYVGKSKSPRAEGAIRMRDDRGHTAPLRKYRGESLTLSLPEGLSLRDVRWFSVWCDDFAVNFGDVSIPRDVEYPRPAKVSGLHGVHSVSSDAIVVVDAQTLLLPNFSYDGEAPDAKFWVGRGDKPSPQGIRIPDENGKETPLRKYDKKTIVLTLPGELTVFDIGHFAVWCEAFTVNFGHVVLPRAQITNVPPSLKMLGVSPQSKLNCEVLYEELGFEVRWAVAGESIVFQLVSKLENGDYMSFGISGDPVSSKMVGGDVAVVWVNTTTLMGSADDYYLQSKSQCAGDSGACPDERFTPNTNSIRPLNVAVVNGYSIVTYQRSLKAADEFDLPIFTNASQPIIWAIGPLNSQNQVSYHPYYTKDDVFIEFGRSPVWNCPMPESDEEHPVQQTHKETPQRRPVQQNNAAVIKPNPVPTPKPVPKVTPWEIPAIQCYEPPDGVFYAQMGPTGGKQGYSAITGHVGWGISWYINGLLIPEINVIRGKKYTFVVEGGSDPDSPARYHPFYITNDHVGGYQHKTEEEKKGIEIYAGIRRTRSGEMNPIGVGRLCNWTPDSNGPEADEYPSFGAYQRSLTLVCEEGSPGVVTWTPDKNTPDTVYYQCYTHRHLGWKINVIDECDVTDAEESRVVETIALPDDLQSEESLQVHSRVAPEGNFLNQRKKLEKIINTKMNYNDFSSINDAELTGEIFTHDRNPLYRNRQEYDSPISTVQIKDAIEAIEVLESKMKDDFKRNNTHSSQSVHQYQVHEDVKELFVPEQPIREEDEYFVEDQMPENYLLPPNQKPLTLQSVLRPNGPNKHHGNIRPPFRRPVPPEIKLRRPPPMHTKVNTMYPLPMPSSHYPHAMKKTPSSNPPHKLANNRPPMGRPSIPSIPPMKAMPSQRPKPGFFQTSKQVPIISPVPAPQAPMTLINSNKKQNLHNVVVPTQSHTLSLGETDIIANHIVKSQIMLPGVVNDAIAQQSINVPQKISKPGQIILGTPVENPVPLDQQIIQIKPQLMRTHPTPPPQFFQTSTLRIKLDNDLPIVNNIKSSDFIGESIDSSTFQTAVNTGFKPESIVVESGFKPIIREPLMAAEDKITDFDNNSNRRVDTNIEEDYEETPQVVTNHAYPSDKITETFEPMFIPSPLDHVLPTNDITKEVFPSNHAKENRPHPVYVKTQEERNALFSKKNMEKDVPIDMMMESDRVSPHYLPPVPKLSKDQSQKLLMNGETFTTYDGKTISAATLTRVPDMNKTSTKFSSKLPASSELLLKTPQFGPFRGDIPPPVEAHISKHVIIQMRDKNLDARDTRTTHLKLVNIKKSDLGELKAEGSENQEVSTKYDDIEEEDYEEETDEEEYSERKKRDTDETIKEDEVIEYKPTNGHSLPINHMKSKLVSSSATDTSPYWINVLVLLTLCTRFF